MINRAQIPVPIAGQIFLLSNHFFISLHIGALARAALSITCVTGIAALYPSLRAAKLQPVSAMSHFG